MHRVQSPAGAATCPQRVHRATRRTGARTAGWSRNARRRCDGPLISQRQLETVLSYVEVGHREGATLLTGGGQPAGDGFFLEATVFADARPEMRIAQEEIFGPVVALIPFDTDEEALTLALTRPGTRSLRSCLHALAGKGPPLRARARRRSCCGQPAHRRLGDAARFRRHQSERRHRLEGARPRGARVLLGAQGSADARAVTRGPALDAMTGKTIANRSPGAQLRKILPIPAALWPWARTIRRSQNSLSGLVFPRSM